MVWSGWLLRQLVCKYALLCSLCHLQESSCLQTSLAVFEEVCFELPFTSSVFRLCMTALRGLFCNIFLWLCGPAFLARTASLSALNFAKAFSSSDSWSGNRFPVLIHIDIHAPHMVLLKTELLHSKRAILHTQNSKALLLFFFFTPLEFSREEKRRFLRIYGIHKIREG